MSEKYIPRSGDQVRVTGLMGTVKFVNHQGFDLEVTDVVGKRVLAYLPAAAIPNTEKIGPALPTKSGSVIRWFGNRGGRHLLVLDDMGNWGNREYAPASGDLRNFEVIYDAGEEK